MTKQELQTVYDELEWLYDFITSPRVHQPKVYPVTGDKLIQICDAMQLVKMEIDFLNGRT